MSEQWITFLDVQELPSGGREVFELDTGSILLLNIDGAFYAVDNICSHEEYELADGLIDDCRLECPKHGAWFDIRTGEALSPPATRPITVYPTRIAAGEVQVKLNLPE